MLALPRFEFIRGRQAIWLVMMFFASVSILTASVPEPDGKSYVVKGKGISILLSPSGEIKSISLAGKAGPPISGETRLEGCVATGTPAVKSLNGGGVEIKRGMTSDSGDQGCTVTDRFTLDGKAIRWQVTVEGTGSPWSTGITTIVAFSDTANARFWTTWGSPGHLNPADWGGEDVSWHNPFETRPFRNLHLVYGGHFGKGAGYSLPLFSVINSDDGMGVALAMSPEDPLLDLHMITSTSGEVAQTRRFNRLEKGHPVTFTMYLFTHGADWRPAVAFMVGKYPRFFKPLLPIALDLCGLGAYSSYEGEIDVAKYRAMGGVVNWKASFDFSYMGMFIPPVKSDTAQWRRFDVSSLGEPIPGKVTYSSINQMRTYARRMKELGFSTLSYFNVTEFGGSSDFSPKVLYPFPSFKPNEQTWTNPSWFIHDRFPGAVLFGTLDHVGWHIRTPQQQMFNPIKLHDEPFWTWGGAIATDVGDSAYASFLLDQARLHVKKLPDAQGICIDRLDWLNDFNWHADDGRSWVGGKPARSLLNAFKDFIPRLSSVMHGNGKAIFCNPHMNRLELMEYFDGVYNEFGHIGHNLNLSAFLCLFKPLLCWTPDKETVLKSPDAYLQHHLFMGAFPTAPFPGNDHTLGPDPEVERFYLDYGKMFTELRGRKWVLLPRVIDVESGSALANVFRKGEGRVIVPVVHGTRDSATIILRHCRKLLGSSTVTVRSTFPGDSTSHQWVAVVRGDSLRISVPLRRGCAFMAISGNGG